ncbi:hypothetical protein DM860_005657 [Cuscuta australis]|uniref:Late embryogenesis abundant protein LEA-2 subgroup domain-containing protein n=1 Tax=Cuscuta australis TaxID=267555 RepID=A0A328DVX3_9ASTE|nr:hypothetical protein DM860_005657 [Cuscuta australis]
MDGQNRHAGNDRPSEVLWEAITRWFDVGRERWVERAWLLFWRLVNLAAVLLVGFVIVWAVLQPHKPSFIVRSATVRALNLSIPHIFSPDLEVKLAFHNRNRRIGIYYGEATVYATYRDRRITYNTHLPPVSQGVRAKDVWSFPLYGNNDPMDTDTGTHLIPDQQVGEAEIDIKIFGSVKWRVGWYVSNRYNLHVTCQATIPIAGDLARTGATSPLFQPCAVNV